MSDPASGRELKDFDFEQIIIAPWKRNIESVAVIIQWCVRHRRRVNALINSMLPHIAYCLRMYTTVDAEDNPVVELNLGKVTIISPQKVPWLKNKKKIG